MDLLRPVLTDTTTDAMLVAGFPALENPERITGEIRIAEVRESISGSA
jgi:hypothetical protein